jgi:ribosomal protein L11 methyltransferase
VAVAPAEAELAGDVLWCSGALAIEERDGELLAGFASSEDAASALAALRGRWPAVAAVEGSTDEWLDTWRPWAHAVRAGERIVVQPVWVEPIGRPGDLVVELDPGHAFGSGTHPSTRLALAALERLVSPGTAVLDAGCGSGVLTVASALLGATRVVAVDIDPEAVVATADNAARNGVASKVDVSSSPVDQVPGVFDVVVANIGASVLVSLAAALSARVAPAGALVLSGLLDDQWRDVTRAYEDAGLTVEWVLDEEGWSAPVLRATGHLLRLSAQRPAGRNR